MTVVVVVAGSSHRCSTTDGGETVGLAVASCGEVLGTSWWSYWQLTVMEMAGSGGGSSTAAVAKRTVGGEGDARDRVRMRECFKCE